MKFHLGTHHSHWLADTRFTEVPLFVSHRQLARYKALPRAVGAWACDSGGFTELSIHGRWTLSPQDYTRALKRYADEIGGLAWASPQDWMCEPQMLAATGLTVDEHQRRTVESVMELRALGAPVIPVLQGWSFGEYLQCIELYDRAHLDLRAEPVVGVGTICRRQMMTSALVTLGGLLWEGLRLHPFGFKATGLRGVFNLGYHLENERGGRVVSSDSLAWSYNARRERPLPECRGRHKNCANCPRWALSWRDALLGSLDCGPQLSLAGVA